MYELGYGGVERQAELLAQAAKAEGHQITLIVLGPTGPAAPRFQPICEAVTILDLNVHSDRAVHGELQRAVQGQRWDAALIFSTAKIAVISHALRQVASRQAVYVGNPVSNDWISYFKHQSRAWRFPPAKELVFLACSQHVLESMKKDRFFRQYRCRVSWNCVRIPEQQLPLRARSVPLHIGMVARLDRIKDQGTLIEALAILQQQQFPAVLHLVGQGEEETRLRQLTEQKGASDIVHFEGTTEDVFAAMSSWDVFAFSTTQEEGFGAAAAEAMAFGMPCIFTDTGPCREVGGETVRYVAERSPQAWAEALKQLASDYPARQQFAQAARERACRLFTKERMWGEYRQALKINAECGVRNGE